MKTFRIFLLLFISIVWHTGLKSQPGKPFIENFSPDIYQNDYTSGPQNFGIFQDNCGIIYIANVDGVLEYDGINWRMIPGTDLDVRNFDKDKSGRIYCGGINEVGFFQADKTGKVFYHSLMNYLSAEKSYFSILQTKIVGDKVFFLSDNILFCWDGNSIRQFKDNLNFRKMFLINDKLYLTKTSNGLFEMEHDSLILVPNTTDFGTLPIRAIFPADKSDELKGYVFTANNGILLYDGKNLHKVNNKLNDILKTLNVTTVIKLDNGYMAIGTQSSGIFIADENLNIIKIIDESLGLLDNNIRSLMVDKDGSIWAGLNYGISKIDYPYCITFFDKSLGIKGTVQKIYKDGENLYLATSLGILKYIDDGNDKFYFKKIFPINDNVWDLMNYHGNFLVATDHGVVIANGESIKLISNELDKSLVLYESKLFAGRIFIGLDNGLASIKYDHGKFVYEGRIEGINYRVRSILETDD